MKGFIASPALYVIWALAVAAALGGTYFSHPYVFGFTTLGLSWLTGAVGLLGVAMCLFSKRLRARDRTLILVALSVAAGAIVLAYRTLATYHWA